MARSYASNQPRLCHRSELGNIAPLASIERKYYLASYNFTSNAKRHIDPQLLSSPNCVLRILLCRGVRVAPNLHRMIHTSRVRSADCDCMPNTSYEPLEDKSREPRTTYQARSEIPRRTNLQLVLPKDRAIAMPKLLRFPIVSPDQR